jgi:hypothetical protein
MKIGEKEPEWFSKIDFEKLESFLKSEDGQKVFRNTLETITPTEETICRMSVIPPEKLHEPYF